MRYLILVLLTAFLVGLPAHAKPVKTLAEFTSSEIRSLDQAVQEGTGEGSRDWEFKRFLLRVTAKIGFTVEVVNLELLPELELVWQRDEPAI